jgi:hypothetical protein
VSILCSVPTAMTLAPMSWWSRENVLSMSMCRQFSAHVQMEDGVSNAGFMDEG